MGRLNRKRREEVGNDGEEKIKKGNKGQRWGSRERGRRMRRKV